MEKYSYDLHLHSCLSPCGSDDMTPANLAGMCALAGLDIVALTDHNTTGNCAAFCRAAEAYGLLALAGMELTTMEEVHVICLFPDPDSADAFGEMVRRHLPPLSNNPDFFGRQLLMDEGDRLLGEESAMLAAATDIPLSDVPALAAQFGGVSYPAHIDRDAFSLLSNLGFWDPSLGFSLAEVSLRCPPQLLTRPDLAGLRFIRACDAHALDQIPDAHQFIELEEKNASAVLKSLFS